MGRNSELSKQRSARSNPNFDCLLLGQPRVAGPGNDISCKYTNHFGRQILTRQEEYFLWNTASAEGVMWHRHASIRPSVDHDATSTDETAFQAASRQIHFVVLKVPSMMEFHGISAEDSIHYQNHSINKPSTNSDARFFQGIFSASARPSSPTRG